MNKSAEGIKIKTLSKSLIRFRNFLRLSTDSSIIKYKIFDGLWFLDSGSRLQRFQTYRIGLEIFLKNDLEFNDFKDFHLNRRRRIIGFKFLTTIAIAVAGYSIIKINFLSPFEIEVALGLVTVMLIYLEYFFTKININMKRIDDFFDYIDFDKKRNNYDEFLSFSSKNKNKIHDFEINYKDRKVQDDSVKVTETKHILNNSEKIIAIDFLLGELGSLSNLRLKLANDSERPIGVSKFDQFISDFTNVDRSTVTRFLNTGVSTLKNSKDIDKTTHKQLLNVKNYYESVKNTLLAKELEEFINSKNIKVKEQKI